MVLAIIGSTGLVGTEIKKILEKGAHKKIKKILFVASEKSVGKKIKYKNKTQKIISIKAAIKEKPNYILFSAGSKTAIKYAKKFQKNGGVVIDNSSAFRMKKDIKLIVPEINGQTIKKEDTIIANPNCSTIQLVMALGPIHTKKEIKRIIVSTYQSVLGTGQDAVDQLKKEEKQKPHKKVYKKEIHRNVIPHCDVFDKNGYTKEEIKIIEETNKILNAKIKITSTAVRVPTLGGHAESINIELKKETTREELIKILKEQKGVVVVDDTKKYTTPKEVREKDDVYVSRIRPDFSKKNSFNMWVVADPLRKGAATNAIQILNLYINKYK